ncbi:hypothetical protein BS78_07G018300 [Paspalum vaginatum]|nr:hypothetical protein BS78_07G018300 [Paspalum vaginatum]KAJ1266938.1 hypothetical protein BS78_07G018300 [Paspalum vaginatum]
MAVVILTVGFRLLLNQGLKNSSSVCRGEHITSHAHFYLMGFEVPFSTLKICFCALRPTVEIGPLRSLASLHLFSVRITWDELECLLSNSLALEQLELFQCPEIICLKMPCALQWLKSLSICYCFTLKVIESKAPNLSSLLLRINKLDLSLVETLQMKKLVVEHIVCDALVKLPSTMPNLETLAIHSLGQVCQLHRMHQSISVHPQLRHMPERRHGYLECEDRWFQLCEELS